MRWHCRTVTVLGLIVVFVEQIQALLEHQERLQERQSHLRSLLDGLKESENNTEENAAPVAVEDWSRSFEWDSRADDVRFNVFGISSYRANQREVININISLQLS